MTAPLPIKGTPERDTLQTAGYGAGGVDRPGSGWVLFAGVIFMMAAILHIIWGIAAASSSHFFSRHASYIVSDLKTWGWIAIVLGAVEVLAALSIWRGAAFGRWFGIIVAGLAALAAMLSIPAYPAWSLTLVALYVLVIYGLAVYGGRPELAD